MLKRLPFLYRVQFNTAISMNKSVPCTRKICFSSAQINNLVTPPVKIQLFKHSFTNQGIVKQNSLSLNMEMAPSLSSFKKLYLEEQFSTLEACSMKGIILKSEGHSENQILYLTVLPS